MTPCCGNEDKQPETSVEAATRTPLPGAPLVVIQCRLGSTRLPRKALALIGDKPMIQHVWERANAIEGIADVVVAVPDHATRTELIAIGLPGDKVHAFQNLTEDDVLGRFVAIAGFWDSHNVYLRVTADCPLLAPELASEVLRRLHDEDLGYASNLYDGYWDGTDAEAFSRAVLLKADAETTGSDRQHVTTWMRNTARTTWTQSLKLSVDDLADLERVRAIYDHLEDKADYSLAATLRAAELAGV